MTRPGRLWRFAAAVVAARRLPCGAQACGPVRNSLRARCAGAALEQAHRVRCQLALRARPQAFRSSAPHRRAIACPNAPLPARRGCWPQEQKTVGARQAVPGGGTVWDGERRRFGVGARSALRQHARRDCQSAAPARRVASFAARPRIEHHSGVGAQRRPTQPATAPGIAWRAAPRLNAPDFTAAVTRTTSATSRSPKFRKARPLVSREQSSKARCSNSASRSSGVNR